MNPVHVHLILNHVAILSAIFSLLILIVGYSLSERILVRTAFAGFVISALVTIPVFLTGEPAEDAVENLPSVSHSLTEEHEEAAEFSIWMIEILGILSLISFFASDKHEKTLKTILIVTAILAIGSLSYTGYQGGKIRHSEIRNGNVNQGTMPSEQMEEDDKD